MIRLFRLLDSCSDLLAKLRPKWVSPDLTIMPVQAVDRVENCGFVFAPPDETCPLYDRLPKRLSLELSSGQIQNFSRDS